MNVNTKDFYWIKNSCFILDVVEIALNRMERRNALGKQLLAQVYLYQRKKKGLYFY